MIYLDNAATTYPKPDCLYQALDYANRNCAFNSGRGLYNESANAAKTIASVRKEIASFVNKDEESVIFASSATEALNQIIYGLPLKKGDCVMVSPFEHNAVIRPLHLICEKKGVQMIVIPFVKETWELDEVKLQNILAINKPKAVFVSQISNVTGYEIPYERIFEASSKIGAICVLDASQGFGIVKITDTKNIDYIVFAGHKSLYASFGVGGFVICHSDCLDVVKAGGTGSDSLNMSMGDSGWDKFEAGSANIVAIEGLHSAIKWIRSNNIYQREKELTEYLIEKLSTLEKVHVFVPLTSSIFGIVSFVVDGYSPKDVGTILYDEFGIAVRTGYHCAPLVHDFLGTRDCLGTVRVSLGAFNSRKDIDLLVNALETL